MDNAIELLTEEDAIWAQMIIDVLKNNSIPCMARPVFGAGMVMRAGVQERLRIYVPAAHLEAAKAIMEDYFSAQDEPEEME